MENLIHINVNALAEQVASKLAQKITLSQQAQEVQEEFLSTKQALEYLQIKSRVTLRDYIKKGILPEPTKRGGRALFFKKSDLKNFLENG